MSERHLSLSEAQKQLADLPQLFQEIEEPIIITQDDEDVMAICSMKSYMQLRETIASLNQTLQILHDEKFMASFRLSQRGIKGDPLVSLEQLRRELGWEDENLESK
ncbi:type II toxin-antitoxin system Phd/YefM family antitoxin [Dictyobacter halimunensis]